MKNSNRLLMYSTFIFTIFFFLIACKRDQPKEKELNSPPQKELHGLVNSIFRMSQGQESIGYSSVSFSLVKDYIRLHEKSVIPGFEEEMEVYISSDMQMDSVRVYGTFRDQKIDCFSYFKEGRISGYSNLTFNAEKNIIIIDTTMYNPFYERATSLFLLPLNFDFTKDEFNYLQYNSNDGKLRPIQVIKKADTPVSGPAGDFDCYHLQFSGGVAVQNLFIDKTEKRIVKITFENVPWVYELLAPLKN